MSTIWDGTCEDQTRVPWLGSETYGARFPFPQIILVVGGGWGGAIPKPTSFTR